MRYNLFGANLGGPIVRNKVFGFFDYSGLRSHSSGLSQNRVPTTAERQGDFSADPGVIYDPSTYNAATGASSPFTNNMLPGISAFAQLWLQNYPLPNMPLNSNNVNYQVNVPSSSNYDEYLGRGDWNISEKNQLFGTVARYNSSGGGNSIVPGLFGISVPLKGTNASITDTYILNDHMVNALKIGYNRSNLFRTQQGTGAKNYATYYGLKNLEPLLEQSTPPAIAVSNYTSLGDPYSPQGAHPEPIPVRRSGHLEDRQPHVELRRRVHSGAVQRRLGGHEQWQLHLRRFRDIAVHCRETQFVRSGQRPGRSRTRIPG